MTIILIPAIAERISALDATLEPIQDFQLATELLGIAGDIGKLSEAERLGCVAEIDGMRFMTVKDKEHSPWRSYFAPMMSGKTASGDEFNVPDASKIPREVIEYWFERANAARHPALRARYADLALEIGSIWNRQHKGEAPLSVGRELKERSINAHLEAVEKGALSTHQAWESLDRAMDLSLLIKDKDRAEKVLAVAFHYADSMRKESDGFYWAHLDDLVWDSKGLSISDEQRDELMRFLSEALAKYSDKDQATVFDPHRSMDAADRLSRWHDRLHQPELGAKAIQTAGQAFEAAAADANALTASAWLEDLSVRYRHAKLVEDASRVDAAIKARSEEARGEMTVHEVRVEVSDTDMGGWLGEIFQGSLEESLSRLSFAVMTSETKLRSMVENLARTSPISSILSINLAGAHGFTRATVGSVQDDMEGRVMHTAATVIGHLAPWLHFAFQHAKENWDFSEERLFNWLTQSPLFPPHSHTLLRDGIRAWFEGDHIKSIHVLVPQIEAAMREWLSALGQSPMEPDKVAGGFQTMAMGKMLGHSVFKEKMHPTLRRHLRALFTDAKGLNVRNMVAHGLAGPELLNSGLSNWVLHALLAMRTVAHAPRPKAPPVEGEIRAEDQQSADRLAAQQRRPLKPGKTPPPQP